jgi:DNA polymerase-1
MINKKKILIFDANNLFFTCYCANPSVNSNNIPVGGIVGSLNMLQKICRETKPHEIIFVWDGRGSAHRRRLINENYKEGRKAPKPLSLNRYFKHESEEDETENRRYQQARLIELLNDLPILQLVEDSIEADDVISYLCKKFNDDEYIKIIFSNDKDYFQLVDGSVMLYRLSKKQYYTKDLVVKEHNILPSNMALARAIEGDNSDNLPGVRGIGKKTLVKHFPELKTNESLLIDDFLKLVEAKEEENLKKKVIKQTEVFSKLLTDKKLIEQNYSLMQLYAPLIDAKSALSLDSTIADKKYDFEIWKFHISLNKDLLNPVEFQDLINHMLKMYNYKKNLNAKNNNTN